MTKKPDGYILANLAKEANLTDLQKLLDIAAEYAITKEPDAYEHEKNRYNFNSPTWDGLTFELTDPIWFDDKANEVNIDCQEYMEPAGEPLGWFYYAGGLEFITGTIISYLTTFRESLIEHMESLAEKLSEEQASAMHDNYIFVAAVDLDTPAKEITNLVRQKHEQSVAEENASVALAEKNVADLRAAALAQAARNVDLLRRGAGTAQERLAVGKAEVTFEAGR